MLFDRLLPRQTPATDTVNIPWHQCAARALRTTTRSGLPANILVPIGVSLRDGDVLSDDTGQSPTRVQVPPVEVWVISPATAHQLAVISLELGNLHVPVEATADGDLLVIPDGPTREVLERYRVPYSPQSRTFSPLRATVLQGVKLADAFTVHLTNELLPDPPKPRD